MLSILPLIGAWKPSSVGPSAPATLLTTIAANGATAFLVIMAMTFGLIVPRMLFERFLPATT